LAGNVADCHHDGDLARSEPVRNLDFDPEFAGHITRESSGDGHTAFASVAESYLDGKN
jgi:hypothetical protein